MTATIRRNLMTNAKHVYKIYSGGVTAFTDFLDIEDKEFIILVGPFRLR